MIIKVHSTTGLSFRGIVEYLLDVNRSQEESRVAFTKTINLSTKNGLTAARVMAATAYNQNALKRAAGISTAGKEACRN